MRVSQRLRRSLLLLLLPLLAGIAGCNTVAGAGEDLEAAGDRLEESAERSKSY